MHLFCLLRRTGAFIALLLFIPVPSVPWGFWAHKEINRLAVFSLSGEVFGFYKRHILYITEHATDPDKRRYAVEGEAECHYIDLDRYGDHPFDSIPRKWNDAVALFDEDTLRAHGIVPWHIQRMLYRLTDAFRNHDLALVLKYSADIGHYIADAHVPLHCTQNYNGQLTGQHGIHGLWESRIPELEGSGWDYFGGTSRYLDDPLSEVWNILRASYAAHDSVLRLERELTLNFPPHKKYALETKGTVTVKTYSKEFAIAYDKLLNGMAERRMKAAIDAVASFWYTAWVDAGQPKLDAGIFSQPTDSVKGSTAEEEAAWKAGKLNVRKHEDH